MNIMLVCPMEDEQTGLYLLRALQALKQRVAPFDQRVKIKAFGLDGMRTRFVRDVKKLAPDLVIIIKGLEFDKDIIKLVKVENPNTKFVCWTFDATLGGKYFDEVDEYVEYIKEYNYFFSFCDNIDKLKAKGVNAFWLPEGCDPNLNGEVPLNYWEKKKYATDVAFLGSIVGIHPNREKFLNRIKEEGIGLKIYGNYDEKLIGKLAENHLNQYVYNDAHSVSVQTAKINLGIDGWPEVPLSMSARLYRTLAAGGFYLTSHTKDIEKMFTPGVHLDVYEDEEDLIKKILFYLDNDELREKIAKAGQLEVQKHTFKDRLEKMFEIIK